MDFKIEVLYEQIKENGTKIEPFFVAWKEAYRMQDGTIAYVYKSIDGKTIIEINFVKH